MSDSHEVIASADGKTAYISNYGGGAYNTLGVIDRVNRKALTSIDLGALRGPHGLQFTGGKVLIHGGSRQGLRQLRSGHAKSRFHPRHSNIGSATMTIVEKTTGGGRGRGPQTNWEETVVPVGRGAEGFDVSPDGKGIWAANAQDGTISVLDFPGKKVIATLGANVDGANRLKFTPDGKLVFVSTLNGPGLVILDAVTRKERKRLKIGHGAAGILMQPDGARAFIGCTPDDYIAIIDLKSLEVTGHLDVGKHPDGSAWAVRR